MVAMSRRMFFRFLPVAPVALITTEPPTDRPEEVLHPQAVSREDWNRLVRAVQRLQ